MNQRSATIVGFAVASAIPALLLAIFFLIKDVRNHSVVASETLASFVAFYLGSIFLTAVLGVPSFLSARRLGLVTWWSALVVGALVGVLVAVIFRLGNESYADALLKYVPAATIAAFVFWLIWKQGHDSITAPSS